MSTALTENTGDHFAAIVPEQSNDSLYEQVRRLRVQNSELARRLAAAQMSSRADRDARRAALNLMEDVEEARRAEQREYAERRRAEEELREANRRKDEFLAMLAHELRNPLAPLRTTLAVLSETIVDETIQPPLAMMDKQLDHIVRLVDDLLDVSRISRGKVELRRERIELGPIVNRAAETARPLLHERHLTLSLAATPVHMDGDPTRLTQVIANLLNNAAKFTEPGGRIWATLEHAGDLAVIRVRDDGIGLATEQTSRIFDMFTQVDASRNRSHGGLGLGLTLVKSIVELHHGEVEARSQGLGKGSEFIVRLPLLHAVDSPAAGDSDAPDAGNLAGRRILLVDDNRQGVESLARYLQLYGAEVHQRFAAAEGIAAAEALSPELVLMDIGMPEMDGYEACTVIRQQSWSRGIILVALTGWGEEKDALCAREAGFDAHFVKPIKPSELVERLVQLLEERAPTA